jgi:hypothetical protein
MGGLGNAFTFMLPIRVLAFVPGASDRSAETGTMIQRRGIVAAGMVAALLFVFVVGRGITFQAAPICSAVSYLCNRAYPRDVLTREVRPDAGESLLQLQLRRLFGVLGCLDRRPSRGWDHRDWSRWEE